MLMISDQELKAEAKDKGYRPEMVEKVYRLLELLEIFMETPYLSDRLALKGGTAINLFCSNQFPRLSIDLDLNYVGTYKKEVMQKERPELEDAIINICKKLKYKLYRNPRYHAGGKTVLIYDSIMGNKGRLEIDLNYVYRMPLWEVKWQTSPTWPKAINAKILDVHELAAGKLNALLEREVSRDLFDSHQLLTKWSLDNEKLRLAFTVYAAMRKQAWHKITIENVKASVKDVRDKLIPVLKSSELPNSKLSDVQAWTKKMVDDCQTMLSVVLPFRKNEIEFLEQLQSNGKIKPNLISGDLDFCERVNKHPLLHWRALQALK